MILLLASLLAPQEAAPIFTKFEFSRERAGHKVKVDAVLESTLSVDLDNVRIRATYFDHDREVRVSNTAEIAKLPPGRPTPVRIEAEQVEKFDNYLVVLEAGDHLFHYVGSDLGKPPSLRLLPAPQLEAIRRSETRPKLFPGTLSLTLAVRNGGVTRALEPTAVVTLLDPGSRPVETCYVRLAGMLEAGIEETYEITVPRAREHASVRIALTSLLFDVPCQQEQLTSAPEFQVGRCRLVRLRDGSARMTGMVKNGLDRPIRRVTVTFQVAGLRHAVAFREPLPPGAPRAFEFTIPKCPPIEEGYSYGVDYEEAPAATRVEVESAPTARRISTRRVEK